MSATVPPTSYAPPAAPALAAPALVERLHDPATAAALDRLLDRVERLDRALDTLAAVSARAPDALAAVTDAADDAYRAAAESGVDLDERLRLALRLAERLTAPRTVAVLGALLDRLESVERLLALADGAPGLVAMTVDTADELMREAQASGLDVERGLARGAAAAVRFGAMMGPEQVASIESVLRSGVLDPAVVRVVGSVGGALATAAAEPPTQVGPLGLLRGLRDPDVRRALGLLLHLGAALGRAMDRRARPASDAPNP